MSARLAASSYRGQHGDPRTRRASDFAAPWGKTLDSCIATPLVFGPKHAAETDIPSTAAKTKTLNPPPPPTILGRRWLPPQQNLEKELCRHDGQAMSSPRPSCGVRDAAVRCGRPQLWQKQAAGARGCSISTYTYTCLLGSQHCN